MATLIRTNRKSQVLHRQYKTLISSLHSSAYPIPQSSPRLPPLTSQFQSQSRRNYISETRRSSYEPIILRYIRNEIQYELDRSSLEQPVLEINGFKLDRRPGEQWVRMEKRYGGNEEIKVEVTLFDGSAPVAESYDARGGKVVEEVKLHITLIVSIFKEGYDEVLEFICSAWPDSLDIDKVYLRARAVVPRRPYLGPLFEELDEKLKDSLFEFLEVRGLDDDLCAFLHKYVQDKDRAECVSWLTTLKSFLEKKVG